MHRAVAVVLLLAALLPGAAEAAERRWRWEHCRFQTVENGEWTDLEVERTIRCATDHWVVPGGTAKALSVARCESGLEADARNGSYVGVYQQSTVYWDGRRETYSPPWWELDPSVYDGRSNVIVSVKMAGARGWEADWTCA